MCGAPQLKSTLLLVTFSFKITMIVSNNVRISHEEEHDKTRLGSLQKYAEARTAMTSPHLVHWIATFKLCFIYLVSSEILIAI